MKAICWNGVNDVAVESAPTPVLVSDHDAIVRVRLSSVCGSDLHLIDGYVPTMQEGDILGHEFIGDVVEVGRAVQNAHVGDRVVVSPVVGCGRCWFCKNGDWSLCDNSNPNPELAEVAYGHAGAGMLGYSHAFGGFAGSHAELVRVPFADHGMFRVPDAIRDEQAVFAGDAAPTGFMAAEQAEIERGDVVAVWGAGAVGQMAMRSAYLLGAERVIAIDRLPDRLRLAEERTGAEPLNYADTDVAPALIELTGGRGPDVCVDAVGMEANDVGAEYLYDRAKQALRLETDRPSVLRQAVYACRKGGVVSIAGVYAGFVDKFPLGAAMNKGLTFKTGQLHAHAYIPRVLEHIERGELDPSYLLTHRMTLDEGPLGYDWFKNKKDGCVRVVFDPRS